mmetsp:Transcript_81657/g.214346  ORF Transcript_81657/g.214346 Transcript_81657/m.214346 type:complete len:406 (+) Transcript_81657:519-1736(+)
MVDVGLRPPARPGGPGAGVDAPVDDLAGDHHRHRVLVLRHDIRARHQLHRRHGRHATRDHRAPLLRRLRLCAHLPGVSAHLGAAGRLFRLPGRHREEVRHHLLGQDPRDARRRVDRRLDPGVVRHALLLHPHELEAGPAADAVEDGGGPAPRDGPPLRRAAGAGLRRGGRRGLRKLLGAPAHAEPPARGLEQEHLGRPDRPRPRQPQGEAAGVAGRQAADALGAAAGVQPDDQSGEHREGQHAGAVQRPGAEALRAPDAGDVRRRARGRRRRRDAGLVRLRGAGACGERGGREGRLAPDDGARSDPHSSACRGRRRGEIPDVSVDRQVPGARGAAPAAGAPGLQRGGLQVLPGGARGHERRPRPGPRLLPPAHRAGPPGPGREGDGVAVRGAADLHVRRDEPPAS